MHSFPFTLDDSAFPPQGETAGLLKILELSQAIHPTVLWERLTHGVLYPTVPVEETDGLGSSQFTPFVSCLYCPFHPTVPLLGMDRLRSYQGVPLATPSPYCLSLPYITHSIWQDAFGGLIHPFYHITVYNNTIYISL